MMTGIGILLAVTLLTPQEAELKAALPGIFAKSAAHYKALDAAATPLMKDEKGDLRRSTMATTISSKRSCAFRNRCKTAVCVFWRIFVENP